MSMKIGAAWAKTSQKGTTYYNLQFEKEAASVIAAGNCFITMCSVASKMSPDAPDFSLLATAKDEKKAHQS